MTLSNCMLSIFWASVTFVFYAYMGYPLLLMAIGVLRNRPVRKAPSHPMVSLIITAYNDRENYFWLDRKSVV